MCYLFMQDRSLQTWKKCKARLQPSLNNAGSHQPCQLENLCDISDVSKTVELVKSSASQTELHMTPLLPVHLFDKSTVGKASTIWPPL